MLWLFFRLNSSKLGGRDSSGKTSSPMIRITRKGRLIAGFLLTSALVAEFNRGIVLNLSSLAAQQGREPVASGACYPALFPCPGTVYHYFRAWKDAGVLAELKRALHEQACLKPRPLALPFGGHPGQVSRSRPPSGEASLVSMGTNGSKGANATCSWTPWGWWWP